MFIILLGAPGAGKGTQAKAISEKLGIPHISTGALFRKEMSLKTDLGKQITKIMDSGKLVDDKTTLEIFKNRLSKSDCDNGALIDGIPRNLKQAELLSNLFSELGKDIDKVLYITLSENEIINRITGRRTCKKCGESYHIIYNPPKVHNVCDFDGGLLYQREDQKPEAVKVRLDTYKTQTEPLVDYYKNLGLLIEVDGSPPIEEVSNNIFGQLEL